MAIILIILVKNDLSLRWYFWEGNLPTFLLFLICPPDLKVKKIAILLLTQRLVSLSFFITGPWVLFFTIIKQFLKDRPIFSQGNFPLIFLHK
jgi:hypothetical protein